MQRRVCAATDLLGARGTARSAHVVTQAHPDHQGASHAVCQRFRVPLWCGEDDAPALQSERLAERQHAHPINRLSQLAFAGPGHSVARRLREGDEVAGFAVLDTPGHSAGHIALWREHDRILVLGDVLFGCHPLTGMPGLHELHVFFTSDRRAPCSARRLTAIVLFGHGPPLRDPGALARFAGALGP